MIYGFLTVVLHTLLGVVAAAILVLGFGLLIFLGDANAGDKPLFSSRWDRLAMLAIYLSWFAPLLWFGFSVPLVVIACGVTVMLCLVYAASYHAAASRRTPRSLGI